MGDNWEVDAVPEDLQKPSCFHMQKKDTDDITGNLPKKIRCLAMLAQNLPNILIFFFGAFCVTTLPKSWGVLGKCMNMALFLCMYAYTYLQSQTAFFLPLDPTSPFDGKKQTDLGKPPSGGLSLLPEIISDAGETLSTLSDWRGAREKGASWCCDWWMEQKIHANLQFFRLKHLVG